MSAKLCRNIEAAQRFLEGLKTLSMFQEMRLKQVCSLEANIERLSHLKTEEAGAVMSLLDDGIWGTEHARLKEAIASKVSPGDGIDSNGRRINQDYMELPQYLTQDLWDLLRGSTDSESNKLDALVRHCGKLGLRNPTEGSKALIVALSHAMHKEPFEDEKLRLIGKYRSRIAKGLDKFSQPAIHLPQLPVDPDLLPQSIVAVAFAEQPRVAVPRGVPDFQALANAWPVRKRGKSEGAPCAMPTGQSVQAMAAFGHAMHGMMQVSQELHRASSSASLMRLPSLLPLEDKKDSQEEEPAIKILSPGQKEETKVIEEVDAALEKALPKRRRKQTAAADAESVAETLARLRDGCRKKEKDEEKMNGGTRKAVMKKPAAASRCAAVGLRDQACEAKELSAGQFEGDIAAQQLSKRRKKKVSDTVGLKQDLSAGQSDGDTSVLQASKGRKKKWAEAALQGSSKDLSAGQSDGDIAAPQASKGRKMKGAEAALLGSLKDLSAGQSDGDTAAPQASKGRKKKVAESALQRSSKDLSVGQSDKTAAKRRNKRGVAEPAAQGRAPSAVASAGQAEKKKSKKAKTEKPKARKCKKSKGAWKKSSGSRGTAKAREAKRQKVLALVPEQLKQAYEQGCSRCRGRSFCTVSCWRARGFSVDE